MKYFIYIILLTFCFVGVANATGISLDNISAHQVTQNQNTQPKLYAPHFVLIGEAATFKVFTNPNKTVKLTIDYGYSTDKIVIDKKANDKGVAVFTVQITDDKNFAGKSIGVDAYIIDETNPALTQKAAMLNDKGGITNSNRVDIVDNDSAKGFRISPSQYLNEFLMNVNYDEKSGFDPFTDRIYDNKTPTYVKNMRDAQENVREIPANFSNSNR